ncbi:hypothetical protein J2I47_20480 [Fibrella sp. HMF5335]|uniref:Uncharacterized protein n=1 Tax=Fibrella rubiginis TaxID=2817060 RepID=A0A939GII9_9BACT|nr:hypothetical protein [Fibrella rubiginis]MBO0938941.1 hypothetical protein [Fibrella rubiginis]
MKNQSASANTRLTVKKSRIVCLNVNQDASKGNGRTYTIFGITRTK